MRQLIQRFVSPVEAEFVAKQFIHTGRLPDLEERQATVLFADISNSTALAERLGVNIFGQILTQYYQEMTEVIFSFGGMVEKFLGDGIMAVFGMTGELANSEERAVRAGLQMLEALEKINANFGENIEIGIGINTGNVMAGYVGTKQQVELTVLGDAVNVAAGLQNLARPNRLIVGPATVAGIVGKFATQRVGAVTVKGRISNIQAHEIIRG